MSLKLIKFQLFLNSILILSLIYFSNLNILPFQNLYSFSILAILVFILSLFFVETVFLFFVSSIILENINLAPQEIGVNVRPYQLVGGILFLVLAFRWLVDAFLKNKNFQESFSQIKKQIKFNDIFVFFFIFSSFLSTFFSINKTVSLKQSVIVSTFAIFYFLVRVFVKNFQDLEKIATFFLNSSLVIILYGIWQNWRFVHGSNGFEVMPGRPNATFLEPDWLALFLCFLLAVLYSIVYFYKKDSLENIKLSHKKSENSCKYKDQMIENKEKSSVQNFKKVNFIYFSIFLAYILLILTMARSGWLGAFMVTVMYLSFILLGSFDNFSLQKIFLLKKHNWKIFFQQGLMLFFIGIFSLISVFSLKLTNFELQNRIQSTGSGNQEITIACDPNFGRELNDFLNSENVIENVIELEGYGCRHINLEEIESEKVKGNLVTKIYRKDPNFNVRSESYQKSWQAISEHLFFGVGWGNIGLILGQAEDGTTLNSSNIFLEIWLGAGFLGLLVFGLILLRILWRGFSMTQGDDSKNKVFGLFLILGLVAIIVPNLFNAGILLGFLWLFLGLSELTL